MRGLRARLRRAPAALALAAGATALLAPAAAADAGDIVVKRRTGLSAAERAGVRAGADVRLVRSLPLPGVEVVRPDAGERGAALDALRADPDVAWAEADQPRHVATTDPLFPLQWGLENAGGTILGLSAIAGADIAAPAAWQLTRGAGVTVAVVDTGADLDHPDLAGRLAPGWDFVQDDAAPDDANGHGTHVAGIIAAAAGNGGVAGVAPEASVMPLRALDAHGDGWSSDVAAAFARAADAGARIVNASLGSPFISNVERTAIRSHADVLFVVAAGNGGSDGIGDDGDVAREYPCALPEPNVLCVGASDPQDGRARFSNYGRATTDLFAPGVRIASTYPLEMPTQLEPGYQLLDGTSMAAPFAAGVAALVASARPGATTAALTAALVGGTDRPAALAGLAAGGRLDAAGALAAAGASGPAPAAQPGAPAAAAPAPAPAPAAAAAPVGAPPATSPAAPARLLRGVHLSRRTIRCGRRCRGAVLSFRLSARGTVTAIVERRRCPRGRCAYRRVGVRRVTLPAGRHAWRVGPRLAGVRLTPGRWRVTLRTAAGTRRIAFRVTR